MQHCISTLFPSAATRACCQAMLPVCFSDDHMHMGTHTVCRRGDTRTPGTCIRVVATQRCKPAQNEARSICDEADPSICCKARPLSNRTCSRHVGVVPTSDPSRKRSDRWLSLHVQHGWIYGQPEVCMAVESASTGSNLLLII